MRSSRASLLGLLAGVALSAGACSSPKSFVVVSMLSATPTPIRDVTQVIVEVKQPPSLSTTLTYPPPSGASSITVNQTAVTDLSVSFTGGQSGTVALAFTLRNAAGCKVGSGATTAIIKKGAVGAANVEIFAVSGCSEDGGTIDVDGGVVFQGCDPVTPACGAGKTCQVNCAMRAGECVAGGTGRHGATCTNNSDCMPGTQCFDYAGTGCNVKVCMRFCNDDGVCQGSSPDGGASDGAASDGGGNEVGGAAAVGTKSVCGGSVPCGAITTGYHTCTFACDPRQTAIATSGCPAGLACLVVGSMDQVDCACAEATRTGTDGADCTSGAACAPGYVCNLMAGSQKCRAVCRCDADGMTCKAPNTCAGSKTCSALTNDTTFGVCL